VGQRGKHGKIRAHYFEIEDGSRGNASDCSACTHFLQDFENALLGVAPPEPGIDGGASADFAANDGLNEMNVEELMSRAAARDGAVAGGLAVDVIERLIRAEYGWDLSFPCDQTAAAAAAAAAGFSSKCLLLHQQTQTIHQQGQGVDNHTHLDVASESPGCLIG
jgi:hypothetical protein